MACPRVFAGVIVAGLLVARGTAVADDTIPDHAVDPARDGAILAGAIGLGAALTLLPSRAPATPWRHELFGGLDAAVHDTFSPRAAGVSDALVAAAVAAPLVYLTGDTIEDADGDRLVIYGEALAINAALFQGVKHLVRRPRPYVYSTSAAIQRYAAAEGDDAYQSFYSAHAATAFCAATAGAYLAAASSSNPTARTLAWGGGFAVAAAAANLRVRAGKHFYSDVVIGGVVGVAIGYAVPALHAGGEPYVPDVRAAAAALAGVLVGSAVSEVLPLGARADDTRRSGGLHLSPVVIANGAGLGLAGTL